ncbi:hypothetical protein BP00DRAFT_464862, partial [Aspergillus indologenus CBS 114.80]
AHTTTGCGNQGFPSAQPYLSHTPGANPFCCMFLLFRFPSPNLSITPILLRLLESGNLACIPVFNPCSPFYECGVAA